MREFISIESLARTWGVEERQIREAASAAGVMLFTLHARPHADKSDLPLLGEALHRGTDAA